MPAKSIWVDRICQQCGASFSVMPCVVRRGAGKYCSPRCSSAAQSAHYAALRHARMVTLLCDHCGKSFQRWPADVGRFCSRACGDAYRRGRPGKALRPVDERFWSKVRVTGECWEWQGSTRAGYGLFNVDGRTVSAHRYSYEQAYGPIPAGHDICHHCDNPPCVRPDHLFAGTEADNLADARAKGRWVPVRKHWGSTSPQARLTEDAVRELRAAFIGIRNEAAFYREMAPRYGVTHHAIRQVVKRRNWLHVD